MSANIVHLETGKVVAEQVRMPERLPMLGTTLLIVADGGTLYNCGTLVRVLRVPGEDGFYFDNDRERGRFKIA